MATSTAQWRQDHKQALVDGVDQIAWQMERKWGVNRLRLLVDDEIRGKFDRQCRRWSKVVWDGKVDQATIEQTAEATKRGWTYLDRAAQLAGAKPLSPQVWEYPMEGGRVLAVVQSTAEAHHVAKDRRDVTVWTMAEVARMAERNQLVNVVKGNFPGAEIARVTRDPTSEKPITDEFELDNEIPF